MFDKSLDSMAFINGVNDKVYYLLAILNSAFVKFWIKKNVPEYCSIGYRLSSQFVKKNPIPLDIDSNILDEINQLEKEYYNGKDNLKE